MPAQWRKRGSTPNAGTAKLLADFFGIPVDLLTDDSRSLPGSEPESPVLEEEQAPYAVAAKPIKTAAALARLKHGTESSAGQATFERHLSNLRALRDQAERMHPRDPEAAHAQLEILLAAYITGRDAEKSARPRS